MALQRRNVRILLLGSLLVLGGCGPDQTLEQAIQCDQFKRLPDGTWSAAQEVSLDYKSEGARYQLNYSKGSKITVDSAKGRLVAALDKKCSVKQ